MIAQTNQPTTTIDTVTTQVSVSRKDWLEGLESLRAYAALSIVIFHVIWIPNLLVPDAVGFMKWYFGYGVPLFFVVSAFSLTYGYTGRLASEQDVMAFYIRRFARISPLLYFMLLCQLAFFNARPSLGDVILNTTFVFNFVPSKIDGLVPASWSIGVEMIFYAIFPMVIIICRNWWSAGVAFLLSILVNAKLAASGTSDTTNHTLLYNLPYFFAGILGYYAYKSLRQFNPNYTGPFCIVAGMVAMFLLVYSPFFSVFPPGLRCVYDALWAIPFAAVCCGLALSPVSILSNRASRFLGKISYSLYLAHPVLVAEFSGLGVYKWLVDHIPNAGAALAVSIITTVLALVPIATLLFFLIEKPGMALGRSVVARIKRNGAQE